MCIYTYVHMYACVCVFNNYLVKEGGKHTEETLLSFQNKRCFNPSSVESCGFGYVWTDRLCIFFPLPFSSIDRKGMCHLCPQGGTGLNKTPVEGWGGWRLMGKCTMVCGDTLVFNHKCTPPCRFSQARFITHQCGSQKSSLHSLASVPW